MLRCALRSEFPDAVWDGSLPHGLQGQEIQAGQAQHLQGDPRTDRTLIRPEGREGSVVLKEWIEMFIQYVQIDFSYFLPLSTRS